MRVKIACSATERDVADRYSSGLQVTTHTVSWRVNTFSVPVDFSREYTCQAKCPFCGQQVTLKATPSRARPRREYYKSVTATAAFVTLVGILPVAAAVYMTLTGSANWPCVPIAVGALVFTLVLFYATRSDLRRTPYTVEIVANPISRHPDDWHRAPGDRYGGLVLANGQGVWIRSARTKAEPSEHYFFAPSGARSLSLVWYTEPKSDE